MNPFNLCLSPAFHITALHSITVLICMQQSPIGPQTILLHRKKVLVHTWIQIRKRPLLFENSQTVSTSLCITIITFVFTAHKSQCPRCLWHRPGPGTGWTGYCTPRNHQGTIPQLKLGAMLSLRLFDVLCFVVDTVEGQSGKLMGDSGSNGNGPFFLVKM